MFPDTRLGFSRRQCIGRTRDDEVRGQGDSPVQLRHVEASERPQITRQVVFVGRDDAVIHISAFTGEPRRGPRAPS